MEQRNGDEFFYQLFLLWEDGPTDAAGAIVTGDTARPGVAAGLKLSEALERNDSYRYFEAAGGLIRIGSTGSNVNDLLMGFIF